MWTSDRRNRQTKTRGGVRGGAAAAAPRAAPSAPLNRTRPGGTGAPEVEDNRTAKTGPEGSRPLGQERSEAALNPQGLAELHPRFTNPSRSASRTQPPHRSDVTAESWRTPSRRSRRSAPSLPPLASTKPHYLSNGNRSCSRGGWHGLGTGSDTGSPRTRGTRSGRWICRGLAPSPLGRGSRRLPADLEALVLRCLAREPSARPASALALREALLSCKLEDSWDEREAHEWWRQHGAHCCGQGQKTPAASASTVERTVIVDYRDRVDWRGKHGSGEVMVPSVRGGVSLSRAVARLRSDGQVASRRLRSFWCDRRVGEFEVAAAGRSTAGTRGTEDVDRRAAYAHLGPGRTLLVTGALTPTADS